MKIRQQTLRMQKRIHNICSEKCFWTKRGARSEGKSPEIFVCVSVLQRNVYMVTISIVFVGCIFFVNTLLLNLIFNNSFFSFFFIIILCLCVTGALFSLFHLEFFSILISFSVWTSSQPFFCHLLAFLFTLKAFLTRISVFFLFWVFFLFGRISLYLVPCESASSTPK